MILVAAILTVLALAPAFWLMWRYSRPVRPHWVSTDAERLQRKAQLLERRKARVSRLLELE